MSLTVVQGPGETMFVPSGWHHQVHNEADTLSVNHNWLTSASLEQTAEFLLKESHAVRAALADLRPSDSHANTGPMDDAERNWMEQCERLQEANAAMGLGDFLRMLDVFSAVSARKLCTPSSGNYATEGNQRGCTSEWRVAHELQAVAAVTKRLQSDRFVGGCLKLQEVATSILGRIDEALSSPEAAEACRQLRMLKIRYTEGNNKRAQVAASKDRQCRVRLQVAGDGWCALTLQLPLEG